MKLTWMTINQTFFKKDIKMIEADRHCLHISYILRHCKPRMVYKLSIAALRIVMSGKSSIELWNDSNSMSLNVYMWNLY